MDRGFFFWKTILSLMYCVCYLNKGYLYSLHDHIIALRGKVWYQKYSLILSLFSSSGPKGHVRYCHHLASVVCPLTFSHFNLLHFVPFRQQIWPPRAILVSDWLLLKKSSPLKLLGQMEPNLAGNIYVRSSIKFLHFVPFRLQIWPPRAILVSDWLLLKNSSPLKPPGQMNQKLVGSILGMSSINFTHLVPIS